MNKLLIFLLCMCFGISIAFPLLYIYRPVFITCNNEKKKERGKKENISIALYTIILSLIFTIVFMSIVVSIQLKCF